MFTNLEALWTPPFWVFYGGFITLLLLRCVRLFVTPWTAAQQAPLSSTIFWSLIRFMYIESVMPSNHHILCHLLHLPSVFSSIRSFPVSQPFTLGGQSIGALASASVLPVNSQCWFPLGLTDLIFCCPRESQVFSSSTIQKHQFISAWSSLCSNSHIHTWLLEKRFDYTDLCWQSDVFAF